RLPEHRLRALRPAHPPSLPRRAPLDAHPALAGWRRDFQHHARGLRAAAMPLRGPTVFISYRRDDASANAGRLFDGLRRQFGNERVFLDTDKIAPGDDFTRVLDERLAASDVLLAVIGPRWLTIANERGRRLDQPEDYVRREVLAALERGTRLIPVLGWGGAVARREEL